MKFELAILGVAFAVGVWLAYEIGYGRGYSRAKFLYSSMMRRS